MQQKIERRTNNKTKLNLQSLLRIFSFPLITLLRSLFDYVIPPEYLFYNVLVHIFHCLIKTKKKTELNHTKKFEMSTIF